MSLRALTLTLTLTLTLMSACGSDKDRPSPATDSATPTGSASGTPAGTATGGTTSPRSTAWTDLLQHDVWTAGVDLHHPTHARSPAGDAVILWDTEIAVGQHVVMNRTVAQGQVNGPDATEVAMVDGAFGRPDGAWFGGDWVVTWHTQLDVWLGTVDPTGALTASRVVNELIQGGDLDRGQPDVAVLDDNSAAVVYHFSNGGADPVSHYFVRRFTGPTLDPVTDELEIATSEQVGSPPDIAALPGGGYVVAWSTRTPTSGTVQLTWFDAADQPLHTERADESASDQTPSRPNVAVLPDGRLAVIWRVQDNDGVGLGAFLRLYGADRAPETGALTVALDAQRPNIAAGPDLYLATWEPNDTTRIRAQVWDATLALPLEESWEPFGGQDTQHRPQASLHPLGGDRWSVLFTADRGLLGERQLARAEWELELTN